MNMANCTLIRASFFADAWGKCWLLEWEKMHHSFLEGSLLNIIAWISIVVAVICALWIAGDEVRNPQKMGVMNIVWPVTALYFSVFAVFAYYAFGRKQAMSGDQASMGDMPGAQKDGPPTLIQVAVGTSHCGAGCMIADVGAEFAIAAAALTLLGSVLWAEYVIDFAAAWTLGIVFQYYAIKPMRDISRWQAIVAAIKADTLSILAFQVGMYAFMALVYFKIFAHPHLTAFMPTYWLMMQAAMICGYVAALPMNWWLITAGLKEKM
jgi:hypothetical protein